VQRSHYITVLFLSRGFSLKSSVWIWNKASCNTRLNLKPQFWFLEVFKECKLPCYGSGLSSVVFPDRCRVQRDEHLERKRERESSKNSAWSNKHSSPVPAPNSLSLCKSEVDRPVFSSSSSDVVLLRFSKVQTWVCALAVRTSCTHTHTHTHTLTDSRMNLWSTCTSCCCGSALCCQVS